MFCFKLHSKVFERNNNSNEKLVSNFNYFVIKAKLKNNLQEENLMI